VELAVVLPLLAMLLFGIIEFGRAYSAQVELTGAVREGVRYAALRSADSVVVTKTRDAAAGLDPARVAVSVTACSTTVGTARVTVSYPFSYDIPFFGSRTTTLTAAGVMRCGG
jgi:Flp pilus assembly protein TadG